MALDVNLVDLDRAGADRQRASAGHGVAGVDGEVHEDLLHHAGVRLHEGELRGGIELQGDGFAEQPLEHFRQVADHLAQVERHGLHDILAAEHKQLPGQTGGAFGREIDRLRATEHLGWDVGFGQNHPRVPLDDGEHIVEVVRHPGGQLPD